MCVIEDCGGRHDTQPSTYGNVGWALSSCHSEINPVFRNRGLLSGLAKTILFPPDRRGIRVCAELLGG
jgi:hypothetical protein